MNKNSSDFLVTIYHSFQNSWVARVQEFLDLGNTEIILEMVTARYLAKSICQWKGGDLISEISLLSYTTAVAECYVVKKGKARREETPTILGKNSMGFAMEKEKNTTKNCQEEHLE